jgi:dienelactone hydrolase
MATVATGTNARVDAGTTQLNNTSWSLTRDPKLKDVSNTKNGRLRVKTLGDFSGSVKGFFDEDDKYTDEITEGASVTLKLYVDTTHFWTVPAMIGTITDNSNGVEDAFDYTFEFVQSGGGVTPPVWT